MGMSFFLRDRQLKLGGRALGSDTFHAFETYAARIEKAKSGQTAEMSANREKVVHRFQSMETALCLSTDRVPMVLKGRILKNCLSHPGLRLPHCAIVTSNPYAPVAGAFYASSPSKFPAGRFIFEESTLSESTL